MLSKRVYTRLYSEGSAELSTMDSHDPIDSYYTNISANGINISTKAELSENQLVDLQIYLPNPLSSQVIRRSGIVIRKDTSGRYPSYGIKFINQSKHDLIELDEFISKTVIMDDIFVSV
jgi:hypothetical protein